VRRDDRIGVIGIDPGVEVLAGGSGTGVRAWAGVRVPFTLLGLGGTVQARAGITRGDSLPQLALRLGGPGTVRGYAYGTRTGRELWAAQLDLAIVRSRVVAPVVFVDLGDTFAADPLIGTGVGLSLLNGLVRFNLAKGLRPDESVRFDLLFRAPR
jgi:hemolysin activation/secretion protein